MFCYPQQKDNQYLQFHTIIIIYNKNSMSLEKVEEIVYTQDLNTLGKWNE